MAAAGADETQGRQRILDHAAALFLERGFDGTSLRDIAASVGMKPASLYHHFDSKNDLLDEILRRGMAVMVAAFHTAAAATVGMDGRSRVEAHVRAHLSALHENGPYTAAHVTTFRTAPPSVRQSIVPERDAYEALWTTLLGELVTSGELAADTTVGLCRLNLFGAMNTTIEWFDPSRGTLDTLAAVITRQFWNGFRVDAVA